MSGHQLFVQQFLLSIISGLVVAVISALVLQKDKRLSKTKMILICLFLFGLAFAVMYYATRPSGLTVAGTVVDEETNQALSGAEISVVGRTESCRSEDNGNFRMQIREPSEDSEPIRLRADKGGYQTLDRSVTPPSFQIILPLRKVGR